MPVDAILIASRLILRLETDIDDDGNSVVANRSYSRVKPEASNEDVKAVAEALASLQIYPLLDTVRIDENKLS